MDFGSIIGILIVVLVILFVIFMLMRELMCWYWKINEVVSLLKSIDNKLSSNSSNSFWNQTSSGSSGSPDQEAALGISSTQTGVKTDLAPPKNSGTGSQYADHDSEKLLQYIASNKFTREVTANMRKELLDRYQIFFNNNKYKYDTKEFDSLQDAVRFAELRKKS
jgi:hypothetical protein